MKETGRKMRRELPSFGTVWHHPKMGGDNPLNCEWGGSTLFLATVVALLKIGAGIDGALQLKTKSVTKAGKGFARDSCGD